MTKKLREGFTTGSCAAAAMKAAVLAMRGEFVKSATVLSPDRKEITVPVKEVRLTEKGAQASIIKDAGDDMDCTNGAEIIADVRMLESGGLVIRAGRGVGTVTKPGLSVPVGEPAINPGPRKMLRYVYDEFFKPGEGCEVTISIPLGEKLAKETLNPVLGVEGGLSVLGTSGIVKPMSEEAYKHSLVTQIPVIRAAGYRTIVLAPGRIGERAAMKFGVPREEIAETSNFIGYMMEESVEAGFKKIILIGHLGKLIKVAAGSFHTHNRVSDGRMETLAAYAALLGASREAVREILDARTTDAAAEIIKRENLISVYEVLAERAEERADRYIFHKAETGVLFVNMDGTLLAAGNTGKKFLRALENHMV